jgi:hypothetical protein
MYFKKYNMALPQQRKVLPHQSHIDLKVFIVLFVSVQRKTFFLNAAIILKKIEANEYTCPIRSL